MRRLVFLGRLSDSAEPRDSAGSEASAGPSACERANASLGEGKALLWEGKALQVNTEIELLRRRSPWNAHRPQERIILGSHLARADILLEGDVIAPEHVRFYLPRDGQGPDDLKVIEDGAVRVNGRNVTHHEWYALQPGDEIECGPWRFRFERDDGSATPSAGRGS